MQKLLLLGDEAIAQAAIDAGMSGMYAYPGTPSTEIMEFVQSSREAEQKSIVREWSANEKTAIETALGLSYAGKRAMVAMKHVGLNVAADGFVNSAITGTNGGLIIVSADDPSMHSSQNEQDSRFYANFAFMPALEPASQQEAYDMVFLGFELSEKYKVPVLMRITTRLAHSRAAVERRKPLAQNSITLPSDPKQFILLPSIARKRYKSLLGIYEEIRNDNSFGTVNKYFSGPNKKLGVIACGIAYNYLMENSDNGTLEYPVVKISSYPFDRNMIKKLVDECETTLVLEDGYPIIEESLRGLLNTGKPVKGRLDGTVPRDGELNPVIVAKALGKVVPQIKAMPDIVATRPPSFCKGCGHADVYNALNDALEPFGKGRVFADIGCYTLGALPPYNAINSCVDMGASVTMAIGAADAGLIPAVAVIGDSTFTHSGMTGLLDAVLKKSPITLIISDNSTTGMTGGQNSHATGRLEEIVKGLGVEPDHIRLLNPLRKYHDENMLAISEELNYKGVSVIIAQRECIQTATRRKKSAN